MVAANRQDAISTEGRSRPFIFDDIHAGCYDRAARLQDMDANDTQASFCFPTFPRFCGQTFLMNGEREVSLACVQAYNLQTAVGPLPMANRAIGWEHRHDFRRRREYGRERCTGVRRSRRCGS
jgi:hypothetical protein